MVDNRPLSRLYFGFHLIIFLALLQSKLNENLFVGLVLWNSILICLLEILNNQSPTHIVVVFDSPGEGIREEIFFIRGDGLNFPQVYFDTIRSTHHGPILVDNGDDETDVSWKNRAFFTFSFFHIL